MADDGFEHCSSFYFSHITIQYKYQNGPCGVVDSSTAVLKDKNSLFNSIFNTIWMEVLKVLREGVIWNIYKNLTVHLLMKIVQYARATAPQQLLNGP